MDHFPGVIGGPESGGCAIFQTRADELGAGDLEGPVAHDYVIPPVAKDGVRVEEIVFLATGEAGSSASLRPGVNDAYRGPEQLGVGRSASAVGSGVEIAEEHHGHVPRHTPGSSSRGNR